MYCIVTLTHSPITSLSLSITFVFMSMLKSHCFYVKMPMVFWDLIILHHTLSCSEFRVHRAGSQLKMSNDKSWNPLCLCQISNGHVDPWDMLNNFCFNVYAQVSSVKCLCWSLGHDLCRRKCRACPVPSQGQGMPCPVANAGHALSCRKFRDTVDLIKLPPAGVRLFLAS